MKKSIILIGILMLMLASCSNENILLNEEVKNNVEPALTIIASQGGADSRLAFVEEKNLEWTPGDAIIVTEAASPTNYVVLNLQETEQTAIGTFSTTNETTDAELTQIQEWKTNNTSLTAYYKNDGLIDNSHENNLNLLRFYDAGHESLSGLNVYGGQTSNNNNDHLKAFNHMASKESFILSDDTPVLNLKFSQLGAIMKFTLTGLGDKTITKLSLNAAGSIFLAGYHNSDPQMAASVSLPLGESGEGIALDSDETLTAYMIMGPTEATAGETITLTATALDESTYTATVTGGVIEAGKFYSVSKTMTKVTMGDKTATQAVKGDYAMADGTFISKDATLTDEQKANVRGLVFWTTANMNPDPNAQTPAKLTDDKIMQADFPNCTHGLIVALNNISGNSIWQSNNTNNLVADWQTNTFNAPNKSDYSAINGYISYISGYQNTKLLKAYNKYCTENNQSGNVVVPVSLLEDWDVQAPENTTGWYIPSPKELHMLCCKDVDNIFYAHTNGVTPETRDYIDPLLSALSGTSLGSGHYWSSMEGSIVEGENMYGAIRLRFSDGAPFGYNKHWDGAAIRAICAF